MSGFLFKHVISWIFIIIGDINYHLKSKSLLGDQVKQYPYKEGANMYVSKFICDEKIDYGFVKKNY